ncbi:MAG: hypothetical protein IIC87_07625 [Chloroflexi bacterium]|nr:hypothetical protein [Chloroflexota bacterium]
MTNLLQKLSKALPLAAVLLVVVVLLRPAGGSGVVGAPELETEPSEVASEECVAVPYFYRGTQSGQWVLGGERELCGQNLHWGIVAGPSYSEHIAVLNGQLEKFRAALDEQGGAAPTAPAPERGEGSTLTAPPGR